MFRRRKENIAAFVDGKLISLDNIDDPVFSNRVLGDGFAIIPTSSEIYSPVTGKIVAAFPTGHAYGFENSKGHEYLLHLGIDTADFEGEGFKSYVKQGQRVKKGDLIASMSIDKINESGFDTTCVLIMINNKDIVLLKENENIEAQSIDIVDYK